MPESQFIQEVRHRADMLAGSFNPGKAIIWAQKAGNYQRILDLLEEPGNTCQAISHHRR